MDTFNFQLPSRFDTIKVSPTTTMFYGNYLCRVSLTVKSALFIRTRYLNEFAYENDGRYYLYYFSRWNYRPKWENDEEVATTLAKLKLVNNTLKNVKHRIERETIAVFFNSIEELETLFSPDSGFVVSDIKELCIPKNQQHANLLKNNFIIHPTNQFKLKVSYARKEYSSPEKRQLLNFFNNQSVADIKVNDSLIFHLSAVHRKYTSAGYFYANSEEHLSLLNLMVPGFIKKIEKIKQIDF